MLYIVATPIGNLEDITLRALRVLKSVDFIAAEDTRRTAGLLAHFDIHTRMVSFHAHTTPEKRAWLLDELEAGRDVALVSDAGTPLISDPGGALVAEAAQRGIAVTSLPGACAAITAMTLSGLEGAFVFVGFLSKKAAERRQQLSRIAECRLPCVLYESPHALLQTLGSLAELLEAERGVVVAKELTKMYEQVFRGSAREAAGAFGEQPKGEYVVIVSGREETPREVSDEEIRARIAAHMAAGRTRKDAADAASLELNIRKNRAYKLSTDM